MMLQPYTDGLSKVRSATAQAHVYTISVHRRPNVLRVRAALLVC